LKVAIIVLGFLALMGASVLAEPTPINASQAREEFAAVGQMPTIAGSTMVGPGATADLTISVDNYSSDDEARTMVAAFTKGQGLAQRFSESLGKGAHHLCRTERLLRIEAAAFDKDSQRPADFWHRREVNTFSRRLLLGKMAPRGIWNSSA